MHPTLHTFEATHRYRGTRRDPSELVMLLDIDGSQARGWFESARPGEGPTRFAANALIELDACSCEWEEPPADPENGPEPPDMIVDEKCPIHGREGTDPDARKGWRDADAMWPEVEPTTSHTGGPHDMGPVTCPVHEAGACPEGCPDASDAPPFDPMDDTEAVDFDQLERENLCFRCIQPLDQAALDANSSLCSACEGGLEAARDRWLDDDSTPIDDPADDEEASELGQICDAVVAFAQRQLRRDAEARLAPYPQYDPTFFDGWYVVYAKRDVKTRMGVVLAKGELALANDRLERRWVVIHSPRTGHHHSVDALLDVTRV